MKKLLLVIVIVLLIAAFLFRGNLFQKTELTPPPSSPSLKNSLHLTSSAFENNGAIPQKYTCDGDNINPPFSFSGAPNQTKSLVLVMTDSDVARINPFVHWTLFNISPTT